MSDLPDPLTPPDCDLRGLEWMPMYGDRLLGSDTWLLGSVEARAAMFPLWWGAWKQCPAGSLPDQDRALAQMAGYGVAVAAWQAVRGEVMRGWVKCSDGRLYHPVVCALAMETMDRRIKERERKATWRARKPTAAADVPRDKTGTERGRDGDTTGTSASCPADVPADSTGQDRTVERKKEPSPSAHDARGTRLPDGWQPGADDRAYAFRLGLDGDRVAQDFAGYWHAKPGKDARKTDWSLTWQGWCRREAERAPTAARATGRSQGKLDALLNHYGQAAKENAA